MACSSYNNKYLCANRSYIKNYGSCGHVYVLYSQFQHDWRPCRRFILKQCINKLNLFDRGAQPYDWRTHNKRNISHPSEYLNSIEIIVNCVQKSHFIALEPLKNKTINCESKSLTDITENF